MSYNSRLSPLTILIIRIVTACDWNEVAAGASNGMTRVAPRLIKSYFTSPKQFVRYKLLLLFPLPRLHFLYNRPTQNIIYLIPYSGKNPCVGLIIIFGMLRESIYNSSFCFKV